MCSSITWISLLFTYLIITFAILFASTDALNSCTVIAPNTLRVDADETILLHNHGERKRIQIQITDHPSKLHKYYSNAFLLNEDESKLVRVRIDIANATNLKSTLGEPNVFNYALLQVLCGAMYNKEVKLLISERSGHVFLQTDKPIYTPRQNVSIRFIVVDEQLKPINGSVRLQIKNPQDVAVYEKLFEPESEVKSIYSHSHQFQEDALKGIWTVVVFYGPEFLLKKSVSFELKEYVLPTFTVKVTSPSVILTRAEQINGSVEARYVYGKPVNGSVIFRFALKNEVGHTRPIGSTVVKKLDENGKAKYNFDSTEILKRNGGRWGVIVKGSRFLVEADVVDRVSGHREVGHDDSAIFATTPFYIVIHSHTPKDFRPGTPAIVMAKVNHMSGNKAAVDIPVSITAFDDQEKPLSVQPSFSRSDKNGLVSFKIPTTTSTQRIRAELRTEDASYERAEQAVITVHMTPYEAKGFIGIIRDDNRVSLKVNERYPIEVQVRPETISKVYVVLLRRGEVSQFGTIEAVNGSASFSFPVTHDLTPSARVLAFTYYDDQIIADSLVLNIEQKCHPSAEISVGPWLGLSAPGSYGTLEIEGKPGTTVGLLAVDEAVYALRNNDILKRNQLFESLRSHDTGCGPGGGIRTEDVFIGAGVVALTHQNDAQTLVRQQFGCELKKRKRRQVIPKEDGKYAALKQKCCIFGLSKDIKYGRSCNERLEIIRHYMPNPRGEICAKAFSECCTESVTNNTQYLLQSPSKADTDRTRSKLSTSDSLDNLDDFDLDSIPIRSQFPETWLFEQIILDSTGKATKVMTLPHSITTWSLQAVSVGADAGVCVIEPQTIRVFQPLFIQLALPYKVVKNEQVEILATVFNYGDRPADANVYIYGVEGLCGGVAPGEKSAAQRIRIPKQSASTIPFSVVPLKEGEFPVKVTVVSNRGQDSIVKTLYVIHEGIPQEDEFSVSLDPNNQRRRRARQVNGVRYSDRVNSNKSLQEIFVDTKLPDNVVKETEQCTVSIIGDRMGPSVVTTMDNLEDLIDMPRGCGEQNMMRFAPTLYTMEYMKRSKNINQTIIDRAYQFIERGYERQLAYRKPDGSFAAFSHRPSSVWLTAFVSKVFCRARNHVMIDESTIRTAMEWLVRNQHNNGAFKETHPILHRQMLGGVKGSLPMTAFVLIAMDECDVQSDAIQMSREKAREFLSNHLDDISHGYVAAIVATALRKSDKNSAAFMKLQDNMHYDQDTNMRSTGKANNALTVEGTAYALLASVANNQINFANSIVNWLNGQMRSTGSFQSTQDTVVALEALAAYSIATQEPVLDLTCNITLDDSSHNTKMIRLKRDNAAVLQSLKFDKLGTGMNISASGVGSGLLSVKLKYNVLLPPEQLCRFNLTVNATVYREMGASQVPESSTLVPPDLLTALFGSNGESNITYYTLHFLDPTLNQSEPHSNFILSDSNENTHKSRVRESVLEENFVTSGDISLRGKVSSNARNNQLLYTIRPCARYLDEGDSNMAVMEVGIFSGFTPLESDLDKALQTSDTFSRYDVTEKGIFLYFMKIPSNSPTCIEFRIRRDFLVGNLQPPVAKIYDYYQPETKCSTFYGPGLSSDLIKIDCSKKGVCRCIEATCPGREPFASVLSKKTADNQRKHVQHIICADHDFAWHGRVVDVIERENGYRNITFNIERVLKEGLERRSTLLHQTRQLLSRSHCDTTKLIRDYKYYILGQDLEPVQEHGDVKARYIIDERWKIYADVEAKTSAEEIVTNAINFVAIKLHDGSIACDTRSQ